jgi:hypothetical protein
VLLGVTADLVLLACAAIFTVDALTGPGANTRADALLGSFATRA